eukprot:TRINITY_DN8211_c0_g3_i5.p1 TRINITY_DN8211_c0_g3~~TRINITY_DN8211_c0_g3_i5.p1  ORF type:complete len:577 (-),score=79.58 TRINITY_DN8211_c0_g3_i5:62-1792(-)
MEFPSDIDYYFRHIIRQEVGIISRNVVQQNGVETNGVNGLAHNHSRLHLRMVVTNGKKILSLHKNPPPEQEGLHNFDDENPEPAESSGGNPPESVESLRLTKVSKRLITLTFDTPLVDGPPIERFNLYEVTAEGSKIIAENDAPEFQVNIVDTNKVKEFTVTAWNRMGESNPMYPSFKVIMRDRRGGQCLVKGVSSARNLLRDDGEVVSELTPLIEFQSEIVEIAIGESCLALFSDGRVAQWGLTATMNEETKEPEVIASDPFHIFEYQNFTVPVITNKVCVGEDFCAIITIEGRVYTWGLNIYGQLGHGDTELRLSPTIVAAFSTQRTFITDIVLGPNHCMALTDKGKVYSWGEDQGQFGEPILDNSGSIINYQSVGAHQFVPRYQDRVLNNYKVVKISTGSSHHFALTEEGFLYGWGSNKEFQLGWELPDDILNITVPERLKLPSEVKKVVDVVCGGRHTIAKIKKQDESEELWSWGDSRMKQCGQIPNESYAKPNRINVSEGLALKAVSFAAGHSSTIVVDDQNKLHFFGKQPTTAIGSGYSWINLPQGQQVRQISTAELSFAIVLNLSLIHI